MTGTDTRCGSIPHCRPRVLPWDGLLRGLRCFDHRKFNLICEDFRSSPRNGHCHERSGVSNVPNRRHVLSTRQNSKSMHYHSLPFGRLR
jgi:hypothetical protein